MVHLPKARGVRAPVTGAKRGTQSAGHGSMAGCLHSRNPGFPEQVKISLGVDNAPKDQRPVEKSFQGPRGPNTSLRFRGRTLIPEKGTGKIKQDGSAKEKDFSADYKN